jgi:hypothetical protein
MAGTVSHSGRINARAIITTLQASEAPTYTSMPIGPFLTESNKWRLSEGGNEVCSDKVFPFIRRLKEEYKRSSVI